MSDPIEVECGHCEGTGKYAVEPNRYTFSACLDGKHHWCAARMTQREAGIITAIYLCICPECNHGDRPD